MNEKQIIIPIDDIGVIEGVPIHYLKLIEGNDDNNPTYKDSPHGEYAYYLLGDIVSNLKTIFKRIPFEKLYYVDVMEEVKELEILKTVVKAVYNKNSSFREELQKRYATKNKSMDDIFNNLSFIDRLFFLDAIFSYLEECACILKKNNNIYQEPKRIILERVIDQKYELEEIKYSLWKRKLVEKNNQNIFETTIEKRKIFYYDPDDIINTLKRKIKEAERKGIHPIELYNDNNPETFEWVIDLLRSNGKKIIGKENISFFQKLEIMLLNILGLRSSEITAFEKELITSFINIVKEDKFKAEKEKEQDPVKVLLKTAA